MDFEQLELDRWADDGGFVVPEVETAALIATPTAASKYATALIEKKQNEVDCAFQDCIQFVGD